MKPTNEQVLSWALEAGAVHYSPPPLRAVRGMSMTFEQLEVAFTLAYAAGAAAMKERAAKVCADMWCKEPEPGDARDCHDAILALRDDDD